MKPFLTPLLATASLTLLCAQKLPAASPSYAVVVKESVYQDAEWEKVCQALLKKHPGAKLVKWQKNLTDALPALRTTHPEFTCFVTPGTETGPQFVAEVHRLTRRYDDDVYTDTRWGILTGYNAEAALNLAKFNQPITVRKTSSGTELAMDMVEQAVWYDELVKNKTVRKNTPDGKAVESKCPTDTTQLLADTLTEWKSDLFITSGHGYKEGWQIGFRYKNGFFKSNDGKLFGKDTTGKTFPITSDHPRIYLPIGNCLIGCIENKNAFALAMMKSAGVKGMIGYTVPTWFGYAGWGMLDYFVEQPGRYSLNEAFIANQHALVHRLDSSFLDSMKHNPAPGKTVRITPKPVPGRYAVCSDSRDFPGLLHDRDVLAYYGDPALQAKMATRECAYDQKLTIEGDTYTLTVTGKRGDKSFSPINTNGSQRGGRPIIAFLPKRIGKATITQGKEFSPTIADDFILIPNPNKGDKIIVQWKASTQP